MTQVGLVDCKANTVEKAFIEPQLMRVTCYCPESCSGSITASGKPVKANYTCGARKDLIGCVAMVYRQDENGNIGDFVGLYEICDTGSAQRLQNGMSIDIYQESLAVAKEFVRQNGDYLYVKYIKGEG